LKYVKTAAAVASPEPLCLRICRQARVGRGVFIAICAVYPSPRRSSFADMNSRWLC